MGQPCLGLPNSTLTICWLAANEDAYANAIGKGEIIGWLLCARLGVGGKLRCGV